MRRLLVAGCCGLALVLTACIDAEVGAPAVAVMSLSATKKLPTDHVVSWIAGRECSIVHFETEGDYCPPPDNTIDRSKLYCTRTLGGVECHERPNPYANNGEQILGSPPPHPVQP